jgi:hypothetical protein
MKKKAITIILSVLLLVSLQVSVDSLAKAQHSIPPEIPVVVTVPKMMVSVTVSDNNGIFYAEVDSTYQTKTVYKIGDTFAPGIKIAFDRIDAYYPVPLNATNISVEANGSSHNWTYRPTGFTHLFDVNLPLINWTLTPVPENFTLTTHYGSQIPKTPSTYAYLGDYALLIPLESRYGLDSIGGVYPGYSWFGGFSENVDAQFNIVMQTSLNNVHVYSISNLGTLTPLDINASNEKEMKLELPKSDLFPFGVVLTFDENTSKPQPFAVETTIAIVSIGAVIIILLVGLLFFRRHRKTFSHRAPM